MIGRIPTLSKEREELYNGITDSGLFTLEATENSFKVNTMKDLIAKLRDTQDITFISTAARMEAANLLERIYSQPVELPEADFYRHDFVDEETGETDFEVFDFKSEDCDDCKPLYTADQLTKAVQEATAQALEAAAKECEARYMGDNNREDMEAKRCASAIRNLIGRVK